MLPYLCWTAILIYRPGSYLDNCSSEFSTFSKRSFLPKTWWIYFLLQLPANETLEGYKWAFVVALIRAFLAAGTRYSHKPNWIMAWEFFWFPSKILKSKIDSLGSFFIQLDEFSLQFERLFIVLSELWCYLTLQQNRFSKKIFFRKLLFLRSLPTQCFEMI